MKMKRKAIIGPIFLAMALFCGCGTTEKAGGDVGTLSNSKVSDEQSSTPIPEQETVEQAETEKAAEVQNNGSQFVKVNDTVYFREYDSDVLTLNTIGADYPRVGHAGGEGRMMKLKDGDAKAVPAFNDSGYGDFFYYDGRFYCTRLEPTEEFPEDQWINQGEEDITPRIYSVKEDGTDLIELGEGEMKLLSPDGSVFASKFSDVRNDAKYKEVYGVYNKGRKVYETDSDKLGGFAEFLGTAGSYVVFALNNNDGSLDIMSVRTGEKEAVKLENIPLPDDDLSLVMEAKEFKNEDSKVFLSGGYYGGTGHFLNGTFFFTADAEKKDSGKAETNLSEEEDDSSVLKFVVKDGKMVHTDGVPGEAGFTYKDAVIMPGDVQCLYYINEEGTRVWNKVNPFGAALSLEGQMDYLLDVPYAAFIDGKIYLAANTAIHTPIEDIDWRYSYSIVHTKIEVIDTENDEEIVLSDLSHPYALGMVLVPLDKKEFGDNAVLAQEYNWEFGENSREDDSDRTLQLGNSGAVYHLSDDFRFIMPDYTQDSNPDGTPAEGEGSGGIKELYDYLLRNGGKRAGAEVRVGDGLVCSAPFETEDDLYSGNGYAGERMRAWFNEYGEIKEAMPDFAG